MFEPGAKARLYSSDFGASLNGSDPFTRFRDAWQRCRSIDPLDRGLYVDVHTYMSMAKAVVSTTIGAEGLPVTAGRDLEIADEPARFAQAVVRLMRDAVARRAIEAAARQLVVDKYDWSAVALDFEAALVATTDRRTVRRVAERAIA